LPLATLRVVADATYWTSASNEGHGCLMKWGWCSTKAFFYSNFSHWATGEPNNPYGEKCAALKMNLDPKKIVLDGMPCTESRWFICEVKSVFFLIVQTFLHSAKAVDLSFFCVLRPYIKTDSAMFWIQKLCFYVKKLIL
jgi:hypothetical protein